VRSLGWLGLALAFLGTATVLYIILVPTLLVAAIVVVGIRLVRGRR